MSKIKRELLPAAPRQVRAKKTYEQLLAAAQTILSEQGIEAVNSNAIADQAGVTVSAFYRYFADKHHLLQVLGTRLMELQSAGDIEAAEAFRERRMSLKESINYALTQAYNVTKSFEGGLALTAALRAIPELSDVRVKQQHNLSKISARSLRMAVPSMGKAESVIRARIATEIGYSIVELMLDSPRMNRKKVLSATTDAIIAAYGIEPDA